VKKVIRPSVARSSLSAYTATRSPAAYKQQSILTAPRGQLVVMLYDGCLRFLGQAAHAMRAGEVGEAGMRLSRAEAIVDELLSTLDLERGGVIASRLQGIYVWSTRKLMEARLEQDPAAIETVAELLGELRESWAQVAAA
jgi:flagellar protein FliS